MSCDDISADWAAQRIKGLDLWTAMSHALRNSLLPARKGPATKANGEVIKTLIDSFQYPRRGPGMMWDAAARKVRERDGEIHMGTAFESLRRDKANSQWAITARTEQGEIKTFTARHVISSAPIRELLAGLSPEPDCKAAADKLRYRDFITVALIVEKPDLFPDNWIYIHEPAVKVGRIQNFRSWSPEMVPNPDQSCLGLEYFCFEGDGLWNATDGELIGLAKKELEQIGLAEWNDIKDGCVVRQKKAYPVYDDGYKANVEAIRSELGLRFPTLHLVGRNGMHKYNNQDHAMMTAMLCVENILADAKFYDLWQVNSDAEYHEAGPATAPETSGPGLRLVPTRVVAAPELAPEG